MGVDLVAEEFQVTSDWRPFLISLNDLEALLGIVKFAAALKDADQSGEPGHESLLTEGIRRFPAHA